MNEITDDNINQINDHDNDDENNENENENNENSEITNNNETENSKDNNNNNNNTESLENENIDEELSNKVSDLKLKDNDENNENSNNEEEEVETGNNSTINPNGNPNGDDVEKSLRKNPVVGDLLKIALYDNNIIITILNMFFHFPWNNFLHNVVFDIVQQVLNGSLDIGYNKYLAIDLFDRGKITQLIIDGQNRCQDYEEQTGLRLGYMGHLTLIAEEVVKFTTFYLAQAHCKVIEGSVSTPEWLEYVSETLVETRNKYNAVLGESRLDNCDEEGDEDDDEDEDDDDEDDEDRMMMKSYMPMIILVIIRQEI
ncbi:unnamed protein product [[Candida] boidinii]|nr:unnamed protein product [[Candida] boidinii]